MTLHDVRRLNEYWRRSPPLTVLVACVASSLGIDLSKIAAAEKPKYMTADEARAMIRVTGGKIEGIGRA